MADESMYYTVPGALVPALGALWGGTPTIVSPLKDGGPAAASDAEIAALVEAGVCDEARRPAPGIAAILDVLGSADSFVRVYLSGGAAVDEFAVFRSPDGVTVSLINSAGDIALESPAASDVFVAITEQMLGGSAFRAVELDLELSGNEAVAFSAAIDLQRKAGLRSTAEENDPAAAELATTDITAACAQQTGRNQWLSSVMLELAGADGLPAERVTEALASLASRGIIEGGPSSYHLSGPALLFAQRFLVIDSALTLTGGFIGADGKPVIAGFTALEAGVRDLLYIEVTGDSVELRTESAGGVLTYVEAFLTDPSLLRTMDEDPGIKVAPAPIPAAPAAPDAPGFCATCGTPLRPGKRFCVKCGTPIR